MRAFRSFATWGVASWLRGVGHEAAQQTTRASVAIVAQERVGTRARNKWDRALLVLSPQSSILSRWRAGRDDGRVAGLPFAVIPGGDVDVPHHADIGEAGGDPVVDAGEVNALFLVGPDIVARHDERADAALRGS